MKNKKSNKKNRKITNIKSHKQSQVGVKSPMIIIVVSVVIIAIIVALIMLRPAAEPIFGKAVEPTEFVPAVETTELAAGTLNWYLGFTSVTGGTKTTTYDGEKFTVPIYIDFGNEENLGKFQVNIVRFKIKYDNTKLSYEETNLKLGNYVALSGGQEITHAPGEITIEQTWDTSKLQSTSFHTGKKEVASITFLINVDDDVKFDPVSGSAKNVDTPIVGSLTGGVVIKLENANIYSEGELANSKNGLGIFADDTQYLNEFPLQPTLSLTVRPPCADLDDDNYGLPGSDQRACNNEGDDCNDNCKKCYPGAKEVCDGVDNSCDGQADLTSEGDPLDLQADGILNSPPDGVPFLTGVCAGYKVCTGGNPTNSYLTDPNYMDNDGCDFSDNDCDGLVNEDADESCTLDAVISGPKFGPGHLFLIFDNGDAKGNQLQPDIKDMHVLDLLTDASAESSGAKDEPPICGKFADGWICACQNGDYYWTLNDDGTGVKYINYALGTQIDAEININTGDKNLDVICG